MSFAPARRTFSRLIEERAVKTRLVAVLIKNPHCVLLGTAIQLFHIRVAPIVFYGIPLIRNSFGLIDLSTLEKIKIA